MVLLTVTSSVTTGGFYQRDMLTSHTFHQNQFGTETLSAMLRGQSTGPLFRVILLQSRFQPPLTTMDILLRQQIKGAGGPIFKMLDVVHVAIRTKFIVDPMDDPLSETHKVHPRNMEGNHLSLCMELCFK